MNRTMNLRKLGAILDRQPALATWPARIGSEEFGDERLIRAANPEEAKAEAEWSKILEELKAIDIGLAIRVEQTVTRWLMESEKAAYRTGIVAGMRLKGEKPGKVAREI